MRLALAALMTALVAAGSSPRTAAQDASTPGAPGGAHDDYQPGAAETDFTIVNQPTNLRVPQHALAFRLTHRFSRGLKGGSFSDLAGDMFGLDGGAQIGIEIRYGLFTRTQLGMLRISDRSLVLFGQHELAHQGPRPVGLALRVAVEGQDNFSQQYSPSVAVVASRQIADRLALSLVPTWIGETGRGTSADGGRSTVVVGLGARLLLGGGSALVGEYAPRLGGYRPSGGRDTVTFGIEHTVGGHCFQINLSNDLGTTPLQIARGQQGRRDWYVGFNLSRKFF